MSARFALINRSGYDTEDLRRFVAKGLATVGIREPKRVLIVAAPQRSRGCAEIGCLSGREGRTLVLAIAPPSHYSLRRLSRLFVHEAAHLLGLEHEDMSRNLLYSLGPVPRWAQGTRIRYHGRAPNQFDGLGEPLHPCRRYCDPSRPSFRITRK